MFVACTNYLDAACQPFTGEPERDEISHQSRPFACIYADTKSMRVKFNKGTVRFPGFLSKEVIDALKMQRRRNWNKSILREVIPVAYWS